MGQLNEEDSHSSSCNNNATETTSFLVNNNNDKKKKIKRMSLQEPYQHLEDSEKDVDEAEEEMMTTMMIKYGQ